MKYLTNPPYKITRIDKEYQMNHKSKVFWLTGLSGSGKSTIAHSVNYLLYRNNINACVFDGDDIRTGLCNDLGFSLEDRTENIRRIAEVCKLFVNNGNICICSFISPIQSDRDLAKSILGDDFYEIYIKCSLNKCEQRDVKGYYKKARNGIIKNYTGITSPYEEPTNPSLILNTEDETVPESTIKLLNFIKDTL